MSERIVRFGVVGMGRGRQVIKEMIGEKNFELKAICDINEKLLQEAVEDFAANGVTDLAAYTDYEEMLKADIDAVYIATDAIFHVPFVKKAMEAGKNVISEIPAVNSVEEARELRACVKAHPDLKYMTAENCCYWGHIQAWKEMADAGKFGEVVFAEAEYIHCADYRKLEGDYVGKPPKGHWRTFNPAIKYITHELGPLLYIMNDRCVSVTCFEPDVSYNPNKTKSAQNGMCLLRTEKGAVLRIMICFGAYKDFTHNYRIIGTRGSIETDSTKRMDESYSYASFSDIPGSREDMVKIPITYTSFGAGVGGHGGCDKKMMIDYVKCIVEDLPVPIDVDAGIAMTLPGVYAAESAQKGGMPIDIPAPWDL